MFFCYFFFFLFFCELTGCQKSEHTEKEIHLSVADFEVIEPTQVDTQTFNTIPRYPEGPTKSQSQQGASHLDSIKSNQIVEQSADTKTRYSESGSERIQDGDTKKKKKIYALPGKVKHRVRCLFPGLKNNGARLKVAHSKEKEIEPVPLESIKSDQIVEQSADTKTRYSESGSERIQDGDTKKKKKIYAWFGKLKHRVRCLFPGLKNNGARLKVAHSKEKEIEPVPLGSSRVNTKYSQGQSELTQVGIPCVASTDDINKKIILGRLSTLRSVLIEHSRILEGQNVDLIYGFLFQVIDYLYNHFNQSISSVQEILNVTDQTVKILPSKEWCCQDRDGYTLLHKIFYLTSADNIELTRKLMPMFVSENNDVLFLDECLSDVVSALPRFNKDKSSAPTIFDIIEQMIDKRSDFVEGSQRLKLQSPDGYTLLHTILALTLEEDMAFAIRLVPMFVLANDDAKFRYHSLCYLIDYLYSQFDLGGANVQIIVDVIAQIVNRCSAEQLNAQSPDGDPLLDSICHLTLEKNIALAQKLLPMLIQRGAKPSIAALEKALAIDNIDLLSELLKSPDLDLAEWIETHVSEQRLWLPPLDHIASAVYHAAFKVQHAQPQPQPQPQPQLQLSEILKSPNLDLLEPIKTDVQQLQMLINKFDLILQHCPCAVIDCQDEENKTLKDILEETRAKLHQNEPFVIDVLDHMIDKLEKELERKRQLEKVEKVEKVEEENSIIESEEEEADELVSQEEEVVKAPLSRTNSGVLNNNVCDE